MFAIGIAGCWSAGLTGWSLYGLNLDDPWQLAGDILLFFSPVGLALLVGLPIVLFAEALYFVARKLRTSYQ